MMTRSLMVLMVLTAALALAACKQDPYRLVEQVNDSGPRTDGWPGTIDGGGDVGPRGDALIDGVGNKDSLCVKKTEECNGKDDDCNGKIDDVDPSSLAKNPKHCGKCGNACDFANAFSRCEASVCKMDGCAPGYWDLDKKEDTGCEYQCLQSNGGVEICDGADNNCDGVIDNGFDKQTDPKNCGGCGNICSSDNAASAKCVAGKCELGSCLPGFKDINGKADDGCEYKCPLWPPATDDPCDGVDNNCDGKIDEGFVSAACGKNAGECKAGVTSCVNGVLQCAGAVNPTPETCNNKDDDCDGSVDNGFDKQNDPRYCGNCTACQIPHAIAKCVAGVCAIAVCEMGWVDLDKDATNGCEYACTITGAEICDGMDNDCNGKVDQADPGFIPLGGNPCQFLGACAGSTATCQGKNGWVCSYGADVEMRKCATSAECGGSIVCTGGVCPGILAANESRCDGKDNNCNGLVDEPFTDKGKICTETGKKGICQGSGSWICDVAGTGLVCNITSPGQTAKAEECNGLDDDCDGVVDNGVKDTMVNVVSTAPALNFWIYSYEASRVDATATGGGKSAARTCSKPGVIPWTSVTYTEATTACTASGKRLCTAAEWLAACRGPSTFVWPYSSTYSATACNGADNLQNKLLPTGSKATCVGGVTGLYDMSGNAKEWTNDPQPPTTPQGYTVRGGAYDTSSVGMRCDFTFAVMPPAFYFVNLGFRCCSNTAP